MNIKEFLMRRIYLYFVLVTLITVAIMFMGIIFDGERTFGYDSLASPLIFAAFSIMPTFVMYSSKELSIKQVIVRKLIQFVMIEGIVIAIACLSPVIDSNNIGILMLLSLIVLVIYILVNAAMWLQNYMLAKKLTEEIIQYQENIQP